MSVGPIISNFLLGLMPAEVPAVLWSVANDDVRHGTETGFLIWTLGALAFGGIFTLIDSGNKGFEFVPKELTVTLTKANGLPRVNTILLDADDFQNIKWIRVRRD